MFILTDACLLDCQTRPEIIDCVLAMTFFKVLIQGNFCQFQSTTELPEGLKLRLDSFTVQCITIALIFLNSQILCFCPLLRGTPNHFSVSKETYRAVTNALPRPGLLQALFKESYPRPKPGSKSASPRPSPTDGRSKVGSAEGHLCGQGLPATHIGISPDTHILIPTSEAPEYCISTENV